jgi:hypothetical protein
MVEILKILLFPANLALLFQTDDFLIFHLQNFYTDYRTSQLVQLKMSFRSCGILECYNTVQINTNKVIMFIQHWNPRKNMKIKKRPVPRAMIVSLI